MGKLLFKKRKPLKGKECYNYGKKLSKETIKKMLESRKGYKHSIKTKLKMRKTALKLNSISRIDRSKFRKKIEDNKGNVYDSLTEASKKLNIHISIICDNLKGRSIGTAGGYQFRYLGSKKKFNNKKLLYRKKGEASPLSTFKNKDVFKILKLYYMLFFSTGYIAKMFNTHRGTILNILKGKTWSHLNEEFFNSKYRY